MKKVWIAFLIPLIFSCGEKASQEGGSQNVLENFSFTSDTVIVDPSEEIINLKQGLGFADLSEDRSRLFMLDGTNQTISEIDLDGLKLLRKTQFEKEGPNGIGSYPGSFQLLSDGNYLIPGFQGNGIFSPEASKIRSVKFLAANIDSLTEDLENGAYFGLLATGDRNHFLSLPGNFFDGTRKLLVADYSEVKGKLIEIPAMDIASEMRIVLTSAESMMVGVESVEIQDLNGRAVVSSTATSDIYLYDYSNDSLRLVSYSHTLVPNKKERKAKAEVSTEKEFQEEWAKHRDQINFKKFFWDGENQRYYRFGSIGVPKPSPDAEAKSNIFLFAYDREFNLIGEKKIEGLNEIPEYPFFKDGKLWSYVNVDDELGFAVMTLNF